MLRKRGSSSRDEEIVVEREGTTTKVCFGCCNIVVAGGELFGFEGEEASGRAGVTAGNFTVIGAVPVDIACLNILMISRPESEMSGRPRSEISKARRGEAAGAEAVKHEQEEETEGEGRGESAEAGTPRQKDFSKDSCAEQAVVMFLKPKD